MSASGRPPPPQRRAMISAAIETAVSSGVRAPRSSPIGLDSRLSSAVGQPRRRAAGPSGRRGCAATPSRRRRRPRQPQRHLEQRDVELRVVGEHADHGARVERARLGLRRQVAVRPVDDDLVGGREPRRRREHRAGVAHRDPVAEERSLLRDGGGEVDRAEHQHARARRVAGRRRPPCPRRGAARRARRQHLAAAGGEQTARVVGDGGVGARRTQRSRHARRGRTTSRRPTQLARPDGRSPSRPPPAGARRCRRRPRRARETCAATPARRRRR